MQPDPEIKTPPHRRVVALIPAGGSGSRFGGVVAKQFLTVLGRPLLAWTLERILASGVDELVVALPPDAPALSVLTSDPRARSVHGGATRQESVRRALAAAPGGGRDLILVHDGARAAVSPEDVRATIAAAALAGGAVLGRPVSDTLKRLEGATIVETVDRALLFRAETPQVFRRSIYEQGVAAAARDGFVGTDEASIVERLPGARITAVAARHPNPKLTEPADLPLLELLLAGDRA